MNNEPVKHHYIPKFILKNFCFEDNKLHYYDVINKEYIDKQVAKVFKEDKLYRSDINIDGSTIIEKDLAKYESEIANIYKLFLVEDEIVLSQEDYDKLALFLGIMGYRSKVAKDKYFSDSNKNFNWKKNLEILANCRSLKEVWESHADLDVKIFMKRDIEGIFNKRISIWEKSYGINFCVSDCYPVVVTGDITTSIQVPMFDFYPISPERVLVLIPYGVENVEKSIRVIDKTLIKKSLNCDSNSINVHKIYEKDVLFISNLIIKHSTIGIVFYDEKTKILITNKKK